MFPVAYFKIVYLHWQQKFIALSVRREPDPVCLSRKELSYQPQPVWPKEVYPRGQSPSSNTGHYPKIFIHRVQHFLQPSCMTRSGWKPCIINRGICQGFTCSFYFIPERIGLCDISKHISRGDKLLRHLQVVMSSRNHIFSKTFMWIYLVCMCVCMYASF